MIYLCRHHSTHDALSSSFGLLYVSQTCGSALAHFLACRLNDPAHARLEPLTLDLVGDKGIEPLPRLCESPILPLY